MVNPLRRSAPDWRRVHETWCSLGRPKIAAFISSGYFSEPISLSTVAAHFRRLDNLAAAKSSTPVRCIRVTDLNPAQRTMLSTGRVSRAQAKTPLNAQQELRIDLPGGAVMHIPSNSPEATAAFILKSLQGSI